MTLQELIQYIVDRVDTNDNFEVSALDVQEAITQTATELWNKPVDVTPQDLQSILDEGNTADLSSLLNMVLSGTFGTNTSNNTIDTKGLSANDTNSSDSSTKFITANTDVISLSANYPDGSVNFTNSGIGDTYSVSGTKFGFTASVSNLHNLSGKNEVIESLDGNTRLYKLITPNQFTHTGKGANRSYKLDVGAGNLDIEGVDTISQYSVRTVNAVLPHGTKAYVFSTKTTADPTPSASFCFNGDAQIIDIDEAPAQDIDFELVTDSTGVIKKRQAYKAERLEGSLSHDLSEAKTYYVNPENSGTTVLTLNNTRDDSFTGKWVIRNSGANGGTVKVVDSELFHGIPEQNIPPQETLLLECVKIETGTNAYIWQFIVTGKSY